MSSALHVSAFTGFSMSSALHVSTFTGFSISSALHVSMFTGFSMSSALHVSTLHVSVYLASMLFSMGAEFGFSPSGKYILRVFKLGGEWLDVTQRKQQEASSFIICRPPLQGEVTC
jgi:hypothetical protein